MLFTLLMIVVFTIFAILFFKMFKAFLTFVGCLFFIVALAFFLRSQDIIYFEIPADWSLSSFNFKVNSDIKEEFDEKIQSYKEKKESKEEKNKTDKKVEIKEVDNGK